MSDRSNYSTESDNSNKRRLSMDEYQGASAQVIDKNKQGFFKRGFNFLFRRSKSGIKNDGMINRSVPCYWHEQK